jgi:ABC-type transport system involved in cytochrome bd biosynthesis fused ATPase/permease subunit
MKQLVARLRAVWSRVPAPVKTQALHVFLTFVVAFVAVAAPAVPALYASALAGHLPALAVVKALIAAAVAAGLKAAIPAFRAAVVALVQGAVGWVKARQAARLHKAVEAYLAVKAEADRQAAEQAAAGLPPFTVPGVPASGVQA